MKPVFLIALCIFAIATTGISQKVNVPPSVTKAFGDKFPNATSVKWEKENKTELEANFKMNNTDVSANFKLDGSWVETETTIPASDLPVVVSNAINKKYPGAEFIRTEKIEKPGGKILYEANIKVNGKKKELELNADGSITK
jgi:hypothetical protein